MIVVDTSALLAIVLLEPDASRCQRALARAEPLIISAATLAEALIVSSRRGLRAPMESLIDRLKFDTQPVTEALARKAARAYDRWGKGMHPARLNYFDCFAYALAEERGCPLLYVGNDFAQTDIASALG